MFAFLNDLCESKLIPSRTSLKHWPINKLSELAYLYFLGLRILLSNPDEHTWADCYCKKAGKPNDFLEWRNSGNDLYAILHALSANPDEEEAEFSPKQLDKIHISPVLIRKWLRNPLQKEETHKLFVRLDAMFHIDNSTMRSMRRIIMDWDDASHREREDVLVKLVQMIHSRAPSNSEILPRLKKMEHEEEVKESASTGSTGASSVATFIGGLGAGFDPDGDRGIYADKKPVIIRRAKPIVKDRS